MIELFTHILCVKDHDKPEACNILNLIEINKNFFIVWFL